MKTLDERKDAWAAIRDDYAACWPPGETQGLPEVPDLVRSAERARSVLGEPFGYRDLRELIVDGLEDFDAGATTDYVRADAIDFRVRGKFDHVIHEVGVATGDHRITVNGAAGEWFPDGGPAWNGPICAMRDRDGRMRIFRTIELDMAREGRDG